MTALVILEENPLDALVTVSEKAAHTEGSTMKLSTGDKVSIKHLLFGLLMESGNDAAMALAEYNAGSTEAFVDKMNQKAKKLGMKNSHFKNPTGLDASGSYSSVFDLSILAQKLLKNANIREIVKHPSIELKSENGRTFRLFSTNNLLGIDGIQGLKTGTTDAAGECFVGLVKLKNGQEWLTIILGSQARFQETQAIVAWGKESYY